VTAAPRQGGNRGGVRVVRRSDVGAAGDGQHHDEGDDAEEEPEDGEQGAVALGLGDEPADDGGDDPADQQEDALDALRMNPAASTLVAATTWVRTTWVSMSGLRSGVAPCRHLVRRV